MYISNGGVKDMSGKAQEILYSNDFMDIVLINPNYPFLKMKKNGVVAVPYDEDGNIYVLRKNRPNVGIFYELPRGFVETDEDFETGAFRELLEETGMRAVSGRKLGRVQADTGVMATKVEVIAIKVEAIANKVHYDKADKESNAVIKTTVKQLMRAIVEEKIVCGYTMAGLVKYIGLHNIL